jgi:hypothetical protein
MFNNLFVKDFYFNQNSKLYKTKGSILSSEVLLNQNLIISKIMTLNNSSRKSFFYILIYRIEFLYRMSLFSVNNFIDYAKKTRNCRKKPKEIIFCLTCIKTCTVFICVVLGRRNEKT